MLIHLSVFPPRSVYAPVLVDLKVFFLVCFRRLRVAVAMFTSILLPLITAIVINNKNNLYPTRVDEEWVDDGWKVAWVEDKGFQNHLSS